MLQCSANSNGDTVLRLAPAGGQQSSWCDCCPYGYHIDLDFVRYCETFHRNHVSPASKLRERRRQRQSMDVLLGLTSPPIWQIEQQLPQIVLDDIDTFAYDDLQNQEQQYKSAIVRDALDKAVLDFEETLQRSKRKVSPFPCDSPDGRAAQPTSPNVLESAYCDPQSSLFRSDSTSSLASSCLSGDSSVALAPGVHALHGKGVRDSDVASVESLASGTSTNALQNIREQMARSLEKMREMEDRIKIIPALQSQLSTLKEEKRLMFLELKSVEAERKKLIVSLERIDTTQNSERRMDKLSDRSPVARPSPQKLHITENDMLPNNHDHCSPTEKAVTRDVGVDCSVLTRDIGVTHLSPKLRNIGTQSRVTSQTLAMSNINSETIFPDPTSSQQPETILNKESEKTVRTPAKLDNSTNTVATSVKHVANVTDLKMQQLYTVTDVERIVEERIKSYVQEDENSRARRRVDRAIMAKPRCSDFGISTNIRTRDVGSSDCTINDVMCDKCNIRKRSIGVGNTGFPTTGELGTVSLMSIGAMTRSKSSDSFNMRSRLRPMSVKSTDTRDLYTFKDSAVSTDRKKLVDVGVCAEVNRRDGATETSKELSECKKCLQNSKTEHDRRIQNTSPSPPVQDRRIQNSSPLPSVLDRRIQNTSPSPSVPSKIPRLARPVTPQSTKRPFKRQDTYTKVNLDGVNNRLPVISPIDGSRVTPVENKREFSDSKAASSRLEVTLGSPDASEDDYHAGAQEEEEEEALFCPRSMKAVSLYHGAQRRNRKKAEPSREMQGALKVLSDSLKKSPVSELPAQLKNAVTITQQEWFKISSTATANPLDVEDYLDCFEEISGQLLEYIVNMTDNSGNTAMHYAVSHGNFDVVSILLDSKVCNINQPNQAGYTSVMLVSLAQMRNDTDTQVVHRLFQLSDVNIRAKQHGQTALMLAASHGCLNMATMLIEAGADVNIQDEDGSTALMCAAEHGHLEMVRLLLSQPDCDISIIDQDGSTALNIAMEAGHRDVGVLLYAHQHFTARGRNSPYATLLKGRQKK